RCDAHDVDLRVLESLPDIFDEGRFARLTLADFVRPLVTNLGVRVTDIKDLGIATPREGADMAAAPTANADHGNAEPLVRTGALVFLTAQHGGGRTGRHGRRRRDHRVLQKLATITF